LKNIMKYSNGFASSNDSIDRSDWKCFDRVKPVRFLGKSHF